MLRVAGFSEYLGLVETFCRSRVWVVGVPIKNNPGIVGLR